MERSKVAIVAPLAARIGFIAESLQEARDFLSTAVSMLVRKAKDEAWEHPRGIYYRRQGLDLQGKVVALFAGQGSQYLGMGKELVMNFPGLQQLYDQFDRLMAADCLKPLSTVVFPPPAFDAETAQGQTKRLTQTEYAQPAIGTLSIGLYKILREAGFIPDFVAGHSFGELSALWAAGVLSDQDYLYLVKARGQAMAKPDAALHDMGAMLAVKLPLSEVEAVVEQFPDVTIANFNSNHQFVLAGPTAVIQQVKEVFDQQGGKDIAILLPVSAAFHTNMVGYALDAFAKASKTVAFQPAQIPIYTNVTAELYPTDVDAVRDLLEVHLSRPVLFKQEIENLYAAGGRCFVEFGPRSILTNLLKDILGDRPYIAVSLNGSRGKDSDRQLREAVMRLRVTGMALQDCDPYQTLPPVQEVGKHGLKIQISAAGYVSEKTKQAYRKALAAGPVDTASAQAEDSVSPVTDPVPVSHSNGRSDGDGSTEQKEAGSYHSPLPLPPAGLALNSPRTRVDQVSHSPLSATNQVVTAASSQFIPVTPSSAVPPNDLALGAASSTSSATGSANQDMAAQYLSVPTISPATMDHAPLPNSSSGRSAMAQPGLDYQAVLESLEFTVSQFQQMQKDGLAAHGKYLTYQAQATQSWFQLMHQQNHLLLSPQFQNQSQERQSRILDQLQQSFMQLSQHQAETLQIHEQYVGNQFNHTQQFLHLVGQRYGELCRQAEATLVLSSKVAPAIPGIQLQGLPTNGQESVLPQPVTLLARDERFAVDQFSKVTPRETNGNRHWSSKLSSDADDSAVMPPPQPAFPSAEPTPVAFNVIPAPAPASLEAEPPTQPDSPLPSPVMVSAPIEQAVAVAPEPVAQPSVEALSSQLIVIVSEVTGYPADMLDLEMDMEADLGVDSIKRVEILGSFQDLYTEMPQVNHEELSELRTLGQVATYLQTCFAKATSHTAASPVAEVAGSVAAVPPPVAPVMVAEQPTLIASAPSPVMLSLVSPVAGSNQMAVQAQPEPSSASTEGTSDSPVLDEAQVNQLLLSIVSEVTGYPDEMLELDMDMEADLGIDSIKRVEILGNLQDSYPQSPALEPEALSELRTLGQVATFVAEQFKKKLLTPALSSPPA